MKIAHIAWLGLAIAPVGWCQTDPLTIWTWTDNLLGKSCDIRSDINTSSTIGCCGSPGWRECDYVVNWTKWNGLGCTDPNQNVLREDNYSHLPVCNLGGIPPALLLPIVNPNKVTFYVGSDYHVFRGDFDPAMQAYFPGVMGLFATSKAPWPQKSGIPAGDTLDPPVALVMAGDLTTGGGVEELGAYRTVWEPGTLGNWTFPFTVLPGLGNHDLTDVGTSGGAGAPSSAQRMWDYVGTVAQYYNIDKSSFGQLGADDGNGTHNYSWDWGGVHYVQLNTWAGETTQGNAPLSAGLVWLANDLKQNVANSTKPVVLFQHYDLLSLGIGDSVYDPLENTSFATWWTISNYTQFWNVIRDYNVIATFSGHVHAWDVQRPEHYTAYTNGDVVYGSVSLPTTDSQGQAKIYDVYRSAPLGTGNFFSVRVSPDYLDVASWASSLIFAPPAAYVTNTMWGQTAACRKKINTRFVDVSSLVEVSENNGSYSILNNSQFAIQGPLAFKITSQVGTTANLGAMDNVTNRDFVDSCDKFFGAAYILSPASELLSGQSIPLTIQTQSGTLPDPSAVKLTQMQPVGFQGSILTNPSSLNLHGAAPLPVELYYYAPAEGAAPFTTKTVYQDATTGWLSASPIAGTAGASGGYALTFDSNILGGGGVGSYSAVFSITSANGDSVTIPVTVIISPSLVLSQSSVSFNSNPAPTVQVTASNGAALPFEVLPSQGFTVSPHTGTTPATLTFTPSSPPQNKPGVYDYSLTIATTPPAASSKVVLDVHLEVEQVTVNASTSSIPLKVDNTVYTGASGALNWISGTTHSITADDVFSVGGQEYRFASWSNGGGVSQTNLIAPPFGSPAQYTASYNLWDKLTVSVSPAQSGGVVQTQPVEPDFYFPDGSAVTLSAQDNAAYYFSGFTGALTAHQSLQVITLTGPQQVTANYTATNGAGRTTIATVPAGAGIQVDGASWLAPTNFYWDSGQQHTVAIPPQQISQNSQLGLAKWSDGVLSATRQISGLHGANQTFTASLATQFLVNVTSSPSSAGTTGGAGFIASGTNTTLTAAPAAGFRFTSFSGDVATPSNGAVVTVNQALNVQANFAAITPPNLIVLPGNRVASPGSDLVNVSLALTNRGPGPAGDSVITGIDGFSNLSGSDAAGTSLVSLLPVVFGTLLPGQSSTAEVTLHWPITASRMQFVVHFSANEGAYTGAAIVNVFR